MRKKSLELPVKLSKIEPNRRGCRETETTHSFSQTCLADDGDCGQYTTDRIEMCRKSEGERDKMEVVPANAVNVFQVSHEAQTLPDCPSTALPHVHWIKLPELNQKLSVECLPNFSPLEPIQLTPPSTAFLCKTLKLKNNRRYTQPPIDTFFASSTYTFPTRNPSQDGTSKSHYLWSLSLTAADIF